MTASDVMIDGSLKAYRQWGQDYKEIFETAGKNAGDFGTDVDNAMKKAEEAMIGDPNNPENNGAVGAAEEMAKKFKKTFNDILDNLKTWFWGENGYSSIIDAICKKNEGIYTSINKLITQYNKLGSAAADAANKQNGAQGNGASTGGTNNSSGSSGSGGGGNGAGNTSTNTGTKSTGHTHSYTTVGTTYVNDGASGHHQHLKKLCTGCGDIKYEDTATTAHSYQTITRNGWT